MQAPNMFTFLTTISHEKKKAARRLSQWQIFFYAEPVSNTGEMKGVLWLYLDFFHIFFYTALLTIQICTRRLL